MFFSEVSVATLQTLVKIHLQRRLDAITPVALFSGEEGYAIFEAESKAAVMGMIEPFFPFFSQDLREMVPWESGKQAILGSAQQAASR